MTERLFVALVATCFYFLAILGIAVGIGFLFAPGYGWMAFGLICLLGGKVTMSHMPKDDGE